MEMYKVSYGTVSTWTSLPRIEKVEVARKTEKTVVVVNCRGEEFRQHLKSDGIRWFDDLDDAKAFVVADQLDKISKNEKRIEILRENLEKLAEGSGL